MSDEVASPKISVIVPVYKVEKYLRDCVESVLAQSFTDFELILVDDGSPDRCGEICDELARKDARIRVFHQENGGVTSARRLGVEQAKGEWICFMDSDDLLPKDSLKDLIAEATGNVDWVQGRGQIFNDGETPKIETRTGEVKSFDLVGTAENMLSNHRSLWAKLVRRKLFSPNVLDIPKEIKIGEDTLANIRLIANRPRKPKEVDRIVYCHRQQENSAYHTFLRTESYIFRYAKLLLAEARKISTPSNKERLSRMLSQYFCVGVLGLIAYGLPIKFPHRLATLMRRGAKTMGIRVKVIYFCLRFGYPGLASTTAKVCHFLRGGKFDVGGKKLLQ